MRKKRSRFLELPNINTWVRKTISASHDHEWLNQNKFELLQMVKNSHKTISYKY